MQIVIDINENDYKTLMINSGNCSISMAERIVDSVFQGKKLPKGHGRLIDASMLKQKYSVLLESARLIGVDVSPVFIDNAPTIIEADKGLDDMAAEYAEKRYYGHLEEVAGRKEDNT